MAQKNILFITPVFPSLRGRGRNFRAYQWVSHLQKNNRVSVFCTSVYGSDDVEDDNSLDELVCDVYQSHHTYSTFQRVINLLSLKPSTWNAVGDVIEQEIERLNIPEPDVILCFRIQNASTALHLKKRWKNSEIWLDIDEVDSRVRFSIAKTMGSSGYYLRAMKESVEGIFYAIQEFLKTRRFDTIFTSTREELEYLEKLNYSTKTKTFKNKLPIFHGQANGFMQEAPYQFMFVGDSNYFPNLDAIDFLLFEIIPGLDEEASMPFNFIIIGGDIGNRQLDQIKKYDCVTFYRDVDDLTGIYHQANAVIVPLRTGGGSSLKFLEALKYKKPVVATPVGARGFEVSDGVQALIGEDYESMIKHCQTLMNNPAFALKIAENGHQWFVENHSFKVAMEEDLEAV